MQLPAITRTLKASLSRQIAKAKSSSLHGRFLRAASGSVVLKIFGALLKLITSVVLARMLGAEQLGIFAYALSIITIVGIPVEVGLPNFITRNVAVYGSLTNWSAMRGLLLRFNQLVLGGCMLVMMLAASATFMFSAGDSALYTFFIALTLLPFTALGGLRRGSLLGLHRPILAQLPELIVQPIVFIALVALSALLIDLWDFTPAVAMGLRALSLALAFVVGHALLLRYLPTQIKQVRASFDTSKWVRSALPFMLLGGLSTVNTEIGILLLGIFGTHEDVGVYKIVVVLSLLVVFVLHAVSTALSPTIAKLYAEGNTQKLQNIVTYASRLVLLCGLPASLVFIIFGKWILVSLYGPEFGEGAIALAILCVGQLVNGAMGPVGLVLTMSGHERDTLKGRVFGVVLNIALGALLIPMWGIEGAAFATACSLITSNVLLAVMVHRRMGLRITAFGKSPPNDTLRVSPRKPPLPRDAPQTGNS